MRASPVFYHGKQVAVLGSVVESRGLYRLEAMGSTAAPDVTPDLASKPIYIYWRERATRSEGEVRGELWDLGRITEGDSRFSSADFRPLLELLTGGRWPGRDQVFVLTNASLVEATLAPGGHVTRGGAGAREVRGRECQRLGPFPRPESARRHRRAAADA